MVQELTDVIQAAIEASTPLGLILARSKVGFDDACKEIQMETRRLKKRYMRVGTEESWEEFRSARNYKNRMIARASRKAFRAFIAQACESPEAMWKKTKWSRDSTPKQASMPPLMKGKELIDDAEGKSNILMNSFFSPPLVQAELDDLKDAEYPPAYQLGDITVNEIAKAIKQAPSFKTPGYDGIPNAILKSVLSIIIHPLHNLFNSSLRLGYYPTLFRNSITIALRKPGEDDYSQPKSYKPIALLNTIGKAMEYVIAKRIQALAEKYCMLPDTHMKGRKLRSTEHGIHYILE